MTDEHDDPPRASLADLMGGNAIAAFDDELQAVADNIMDPNTKAAVPRSVTLKLTILPNEGRDIGTVKVEVSSKLAPPQAQATTFFMGRSRGVTVLSEKDARQLPMFDDGPPGLTTTRPAVDRQKENDDGR